MKTRNYPLCWERATGLRMEFCDRVLCHGGKHSWAIDEPKKSDDRHLGVLIGYQNENPLLFRPYGA